MAHAPEWSESWREEAKELIHDGDGGAVVAAPDPGAVQPVAGPA
jgi:hypothetical protein